MLEMIEASVILTENCRAVGQLVEECDAEQALRETLQTGLRHVSLHRVASSSPPSHLDEEQRGVGVVIVPTVVLTVDDADVACRLKHAVERDARKEAARGVSV